MATSEALLVGRERHRAVGLVVGFAAALAILFGAVLLAGRLDLGTTATLVDRMLPPLVTYGPAPLAAVGAYARCGGPACLAVGVVPAVVLAVVATAGLVVGIPTLAGDVAVWELTVGVGAVGLTSAFGGYCAGVTAALAADLLGIGSDPDA